MARAAKAKTVEMDASVRVLVLHGPEEAIKRDKVEELRKALVAEHGDVEPIHFDGKVAALAEVFDEVRGYSLMGTYKLVVVDPADDFVKAHREPLERYAQGPVDHATLVLRANTWHKGNLDKHIAKVGAVVKCDAPKAGEAVARLVTRAKDVHGITIERPAAQLLVDRLGLHLFRLETELDKLAAMAGEEGKIDRDMVEREVGKSSDEKAWEIQEQVLAAMGSGDSGKLVEKVRELVDVGGQPDVLVMYFVTDLMRKLAVAGQMKGAGASDSEIGKAMKLWGPRQGMFMQVLRGLGSIKAAALLDRALAADARGKSGLGKSGRNLEGFCATLVDV